MNSAQISPDKEAWVDSFAMQLGRMVSDLDVHQAVEFAGASYGDAFDLNPIEAAEIFALELPPREAGE